MPRQSTAKVTRIARKSTSRKAAPKPTLKTATGPCFLTLGPGWAHQDVGSPVAGVVILDGLVAQLSLRLAVKDAATATWAKLATIPDFHYCPDTALGGLVCTVRDASTNKWYPAMAAVTHGGIISVQRIGGGVNGALVKPFAIGAGDEVHLHVAYYTM